MSIYRRKFKSKDATGNVITKIAKTYTAEFRHNNRLYRRGGFIDREMASTWAKTESLRLTRGEFGIVKPMLSNRVLPLITEYVDRLKSLGRDAMYCYTTDKRLRKLANVVAWQVLGDISMTGFEAWRRKPHKWRGEVINAKTINQYIDSATAFCDWLVKDKGLLASNPLERATKSHYVRNISYRRAATMEEINSLIAHAPDSRAVFYQFLFYTPLRMKSVKRLKWKDVHLDDKRPWLEIPADNAKSRKRERSAIRYDIAHMLRKLKEGRVDNDLVFNPTPSTDELRTDLKAAGVVFSDTEGNRRLDFHSFRKTLVRMMKRSGVTLDQAAAALHHKDRRTTEKYYDDDMVDAPLTEALELLPSLTPMKVAK